MKAPWEDIVVEWEALASATYMKAQALTEHADISAVYEEFKGLEADLFERTGWTYDEFRAVTLSRVSGEIDDSGGVEQ